MHIGVLGISHKSAAIGLREKISHACRKKLSAESALAENLHCVVISTCNRTEVYFSAENLAEAHSALLNTLREEISIAFEHKLYSYFGVDCFLHLAHVVSGLDSVIIAESEILRQVKVAYECALLHYKLPSSMHYLFQKSFKLGKEIRSRALLLEGKVTVEKTLFATAQSLLKDLRSLSVLFIGNSEINRKVISHFKRKGVHQLTLCTRSLFSAQEIAEKEKLQLLSWDMLPEWQRYDLVICGSNVPRYAIEAVNGREGSLKTQLIFDLGVPRNVNPQLIRHPQLSLLNMEEISQLLESDQRKNLLGIETAEKVIFERVHRYLHAFHQRAIQCV